ncbi:pilus assembly protein [Parasalinivibrio latis]|uniref:TadE/TadG family type IV pilus assembly protein n=1 Tax=Parasalinivibrio latis TaxID=2952610 RepID=UPI0030DF963D
MSPRFSRAQLGKQSNQRGVVAIEFSIGFFAFMLLFLSWAEACYMGYISSVVDYAISESSRMAKASIAPQSQDSQGDPVPGTADYHTAFKTLITDKSSMWANFIDPDKFTLSTFHFKALDDIAQPCEDGTTLDACLAARSSPAFDAPIAIYHIGYEYTPIFNLFISSETVGLSREVIVIQEFERDKFVN